MRAKWKLRLAGLAFLALGVVSCSSTLTPIALRLSRTASETIAVTLLVLALVLWGVGVNLFRAAEGRLHGGSVSQTIPTPLLFVVGPMLGVLAGAAKAPVLLEFGALGYVLGGAAIGLVAATAICLQACVITKLGVPAGFAESRELGKREET